MIKKNQIKIEKKRQKKLENKIKKTKERKESLLGIRLKNKLTIFVQSKEQKLKL